MTDYTPGSTYHGFVLEKMEFVAEIDSTVYLFTHKTLGTPAFAIKNNDPNKTFCLAFQTVPEDSTGVAHILEHSVLMGSKKYPVHDVFGEINKGGLMTFLNAMTGSDTTWYPFATRNMTEYFNIMDVYCDVTLNPLLEKTTFEQEGWRYHKESLDAPMQFQGVVYNEMKGAFSDPFRALFHHMFNGLLPGSTYAHESGGDPRHIPDLSYEQFVDFHQTHYHPSNSMLFFYGNADLDQELALVQDNFLCNYSKPGKRSTIVAGTDIKEPVYINDSYGVQPGTELIGKTFLAVGSTVGTVLDRKRNAAFQIIANILYNSDASPLKKAIVEAGLCADFGGFFMASSCYKTIMMTYLVGCDPEKRDQFLGLYNQVLSEMTVNGIEEDLILSELNKYEFSVREELTKAQRGLDLIGKALPALKHGTDPFTALTIDDIFAEIRQQALSANYFEQLISKYLLDNAATAVVTLRPDPDKLSLAMQEEEQRLRHYEDSLNQEQLQSLVQRTKQLMVLQQQGPDEQSLTLLPRLSRNDLDRAPEYPSLDVEKSDSTTFLLTEQDTNGILYMDFGLDCSTIATDLLPRLDLFATIATEIGTADRNYVKFAKDINTFTGGLSHSFNTYIHKDNVESLQPVLWIQIKALENYIGDAFSLVKDVFTSLDLTNRQRIREIVLREFSWAEHTIQSEGYSLASTRVFAHLSKAGQINEHVSGATAYLALKELAQNYDRHEEAFLQDLHTIKNMLFQCDKLLISATGSQEDIAQFRQHASSLQKLLPKLTTTTDFSLTKMPRKQAFCTSAEVVYNVQGCNLFTDQNRYNGHFEVLKTWLSRDYLWNTVRQQGGAYGCFVQFNHITGNFALVSYRDPQIQQTYQAYEAIAQSVEQLNLSSTALEQLVIGTYGSFTPLQSPAAQGITARNEYLSGITATFKQNRINSIIETTTDDMRSFADSFGSLKDNSYRATIGNSDKIQENSELFDDIKTI